MPAPPKIDGILLTRGHGAAIAAGSTLIFATLSWLIFSYGYIEDDAFIHLEFSRSLVEGHGFSFNGRIANGDTAPFWVFLLAGMGFIGFNWLAATKLLCGMGVMISATGIWRLANDIVRDDAGQKIFAVECLLLIIFNPYFVHWSFSGMETLTALGVSIWVIWAVFSPQPASPYRLTLGACLLGIAPLLRPELLLLSAAAGVALLYRTYQIFPRSRHRYSTVAAFAILISLPTLLWCGYSFETFGSVIPNTNAAKRGGSFASVAMRLASVYLLGFSGIVALLPFTAKRLLRPGVPKAIIALVLWPTACVAFYIADHTIVQTRYCLLSMPALTIAVVWLLHEVADRIWARTFVVLLSLFNFMVIVAVVIPHVSNKILGGRTNSMIAAYIRNNVPALDPIAVYAIGQLAFESRHPLVDIGGITMPSVLLYMDDPSAVVRWAKRQGAKFYIGEASPEPGSMLLVGYDGPYVGWSLRHADYGTSRAIGIYTLP